LPALVGDRDRAGIENVRRVSAALCKHKIDHVVINWNGFPNFHGKDLFDLLKSLNGQTPLSLLIFFFSLPSSLFSVFSILSRPLYLYGARAAKPKAVRAGASDEAI
jgi:hypothetical protein